MDTIWALTPPSDVAQTVWSAYHGDKLHWYVPEELKAFDIQATAEPEVVRQERAALAAFRE